MGREHDAGDNHQNEDDEDKRQEEDRDDACNPRGGARLRDSRQKREQRREHEQYRRDNTGRAVRNEPRVRAVASGVEPVRPAVPRGKQPDADREQHDDGDEEEEQEDEEQRVVQARADGRRLPEDGGARARRGSRSRGPRRAPRLARRVLRPGARLCLSARARLALALARARALALARAPALAGVRARLGDGLLRAGVAAGPRLLRRLLRLGRHCSGVGSARGGDGARCGRG